MDELLLKAAREGDLPAAKAALGNGASKDATTDFGFTALIVATTAGHLPIVRLLLDTGVDVDHRDRHGISALHQAHDSTEILEALLNAGADVDITTKQGITPLMCAAANGDLESVLLLLARGADPNRRDDGGSTAAEIADEKGQDNVAAILQSLGDKREDTCDA